MATPKSTKERIFRQLRKDTSHRDHRPKKRSLGAAIRAKVGKSGNNDPHSNRPRLHNELGEGLKYAVVFLRDNVKKTGNELNDSVNDFEYKEDLKKLVQHLISAGLGGWKRQGDHYINESGHTAYKENWELSKDGRLIPKSSGKVPDYGIDKLLEIRSYCGD
jgi:hypothetical protein